MGGTSGSAIRVREMADRFVVRGAALRGHEERRPTLRAFEGPRPFSRRTDRVEAAAQRIARALAEIAEELRDGH
jgi:hypothetical protein